MPKKKLPSRDDILLRMWQLANADAQDALKLICSPEDEIQHLGNLNLDALTEFKRGANGVVELKFTDRAKLLERLLDAASEDPAALETFLQAIDPKEV